MFSWFDKFLAAMWIFFMFFFTAGLAFGHSATVRFLDTQAGLLTVQVGEGTRWIRDQVVKGFVKPVEVRAQWLELGQFLVKAAVRLLKMLLDSVFNVFRRLLDKAGDFIRQFASMVNSSQGAFDLLSIVGGRKSICGMATEIIQDFVNQIELSYMSPWEYAWTQTQRWAQTQVDGAYALVTGSPAYAQQTFADQCNFTIFDGPLDTVSLDQPVLPGFNPNAGSSSSARFGSSTNDIETTKRFTEAAVYKIADAAATGKNTEPLKNAVTNVVQQQAQANGFTNDQCRQFNRDFAGGLFLFNRCSGGGEAILSSSQTKDSLNKVADTAKQGAGNANASFSQNAKPGSTVAIRDASKVKAEDKTVPLIADANVRFSTDPRSLATLSTDALRNADFVGDPKKAVIVEPVTDAQQNLNQAMNSVDRKANTGGGGEDDGDLMKQIQDMILNFLEQYALELLNQLTDNASFIACGVLNFDGFCNSVTMASSNLERDISNFFQRRQNQINSASLDTRSLDKLALYNTRNYLGFEPSYSTV